MTSFTDKLQSTGERAQELQDSLRTLLLLVSGRANAGKTTLIDALINGEGQGNTCSDDEFPDPRSRTRVVNYRESVFQNWKLYYVELPCFDDPRPFDGLILARIATFLKDKLPKHGSQAIVCGLVYVHEFDAPAGPQAQNNQANNLSRQLCYLRKVLGKKHPELTFLVLNKYNHQDPTNQRQNALQDAWKKGFKYSNQTNAKNLSNRTNHHVQWNNDLEALKEVLEATLANGNMDVKLAKELRDGKELSKTTAGKLCVKNAKTEWWQHRKQRLGFVKAKLTRGNDGESNVERALRLEWTWLEHCKFPFRCDVNCRCQEGFECGYNGTCTCGSHG